MCFEGIVTFLVVLCVVCEKSGCVFGLLVYFVFVVYSVCFCNVSSVVYRRNVLLYCMPLPFFCVVFSNVYCTMVMTGIV